MQIRTKRYAVVGAVLAVLAGGIYWKMSEPARLASAAMRDVLFDPDSARYDGVRRGGRFGAVPAVCGYVNAKNKFGAYVGRTRFIVTYGKSAGPDGSVSLEDDLPEAYFRGKWGLYCDS